MTKKENKEIEAMGMTIRERQVASAFALVENARATISIAWNMLGNLKTRNSENLATDFHAALDAVENVCLKLGEILDENTNWNDIHLGRLCR